MIEYTGSLNTRKKLTPLIKKAIRIYKNQKTRTTNKNVYSFKNYGKKGITVKYTLRQFVFWFLEKTKNLNNINNIVVGRIDHSKNYTLDNIQIETKSESSKEATKRNKHIFGHPVIVYERITGKLIGRCDSLKEASNLYGNSFSSVHRIANNMIKNPRTKYIYKLEKQNELPKL